MGKVATIFFVVMLVAAAAFVVPKAVNGFLGNGGQDSVSAVLGDQTVWWVFGGLVVVAFVVLILARRAS